MLNFLVASGHPSMHVGQRVGRDIGDTSVLESTREKGTLTIILHLAIRIQQLRGGLDMASSWK